MCKIDMAFGVPISSEKEDYDKGIANSASLAVIPVPSQVTILKGKNY